MKYRCFIMPWGKDVDVVTGLPFCMYVGIDYCEDAFDKRDVSSNIVDYLQWEQIGEQFYYEL
jgi:hypothetical protein